MTRFPTTRPRRGERGPADTTPPGPVTSFTATAGDTQNSLSWVNPGGDFAGTMIRFSTAGYPGSPTGGTLLYNGTGTSTTHTGLTNGVTYYYSAFAYDEVPNYSSAAPAARHPRRRVLLPGRVQLPRRRVGRPGRLDRNRSGVPHRGHGLLRSRLGRIAGQERDEDDQLQLVSPGSSGSGCWPTGERGPSQCGTCGSTTRPARTWPGGMVRGLPPEAGSAPRAPSPPSANLQGGGLWDSLVVKIDPAGQHDPVLLQRSRPGRVQPRLAARQCCRRDQDRAREQQLGGRQLRLPGQHQSQS